MNKEILTQSEAISLYRKLLLARLCEEKIREEYFRDEMKTPVHLGIGGEAIPIGVCHCLSQHSEAFGTYRNHSLYLAMTGDTDSFFGELYGKACGAGKGKAGSMHLCAPEKGFIATSAVVGTTIPLAVGAALAHQYRGEKKTTAVFFGDGALEEGIFWESLNFACLKKLPVLFVCEDNDLAIHTFAGARRGFESILGGLSGFGCHAAQGEGTDLLDVVETTRGILKKMEEDPAPGFLRFPYYRFLEHVGPREDFDAGYRERPSPEEAEYLDPLIRFEKELARWGLASSDLLPVRKEIAETIRKSVATARSAPFPSPEELFTDVFAT